MENRLGLKLHGMEEKVDKNTSEIRSLKDRADKSDLELDDRITRVVCGLSGMSAPPGPSALQPPIPPGRPSAPRTSGLRMPRTAPQADRHEDHYDVARRSLRLWPVPDPDLEKSLAAFLTDKLKFPPDFTSTIGPMRVGKHYDPRSKAKDEVIVVFSNRETRDAIRAAAPNLSGNNNAGIRIQVPGHLLTNFKALENLGYQMRKVDRNVRRVIKFDDAAQDMVMDVKIGDQWRRIRPSEALQAKRNNPRLEAGPAEMTMANITDFFAPDPNDDDSMRM